jgi:hypothetical protein
MGVFNLTAKPTVFVHTDNSHVVSRLYNYNGLAFYANTGYSLLTLSIGNSAPATISLSQSQNNKSISPNFSFPPPTPAPSKPADPVVVNPAIVNGSIPANAGTIRVINEEVVLLNVLGNDQKPGFTGFTYDYGHTEAVGNTMIFVTNHHIRPAYGVADGVESVITNNYAPLISGQYQTYQATYQNIGVRYTVLVTPSVGTPATIVHTFLANVVAY